MRVLLSEPTRRGHAAPAEHSPHRCLRPCPGLRLLVCFRCVPGGGPQAKAERKAKLIADERFEAERLFKKEQIHIYQEAKDRERELEEQAERERLALEEERAARQAVLDRERLKFRQQETQQLSKKKRVKKQNKMMEEAMRKQRLDELVTKVLPALCAPPCAPRPMPRRSPLASSSVCGRARLHACFAPTPRGGAVDWLSRAAPGAPMRRRGAPAAPPPAPVRCSTALAQMFYRCPVRLGAILR